MVIKFYCNRNGPPSQVVWMVLKELNLEYEQIEVNLSPSDGDKKELVAVNPHGKAPAIIDGDLCLGESHAIAIYLCTKYEPTTKKNVLYPKDVQTAAKMNMELFADTDCLAATSLYLNLDAIARGKAKGVNPEYLDKVKRHLETMEATLMKHDYLAGEHLTILDFCKLNIMGMLDIAEFDGWGEYPKIQAWRERMKKLPYYEECHAKGFRESAAMYKKANE